MINGIDVVFVMNQKLIIFTSIHLRILVLYEDDLCHIWPSTRQTIIEITSGIVISRTCTSHLYYSMIPLIGC